MVKYIWIGKRKNYSGSHPYEINWTKKGWNRYHGWPTPLETFYKQTIEKYDIKLEPGEVAKLELKLIRK